MINNYYTLENPETVNKLINRYPSIERFLNENVEKFKKIIGYPICLSAIVEKPCGCSDEEEDLLWIYIEANGELNPDEEFDVESSVFQDIIGPEYFNLNGMVGVSVR
jgi:hypothetical protein